MQRKEWLGVGPHLIEKEERFNLPKLDVTLIVGHLKMRDVNLNAI